MLRNLALIVVASALMTGPVAMAAADKETSYDIEVLVFENRLPELIGDELLAKDPKALVIRDLDKAVLPDTTPSDSLLGSLIAQQLGRDGHYRLLSQARWQQTLDPSGKATVKPVRISGGTAGELDGTILLYLSRYLHMDVNLLFRDNTSSSAPLTFRLSEQRRVKGQETHYFDHPRFGVLVRILPLEKDKKS